MTQIKLDPVELKARSNEIKNIYHDSQALIDKIDNKITTICEAWDGLAQDSFFESYVETKKSLDKLPEIINGISDMLDAASEQLSNTDDSLSSAFNGNNEGSQTSNIGISSSGNSSTSNTGHSSSGNGLSGGGASGGGGGSW